MSVTVYLSSTLKDLEPERRAVQDALSGLCVVKQSYGASEKELVESCLSDVAECDLYIGILGLRYGHIPGRPFRNEKKLSITQLEYQHARVKRIQRLVFLKDESMISVTHTDLKTKEHPPERIERFRALASREQRPALFTDVPQLRELVLKAFNAFEKKRLKSDSSKSPRRGAARGPSHDGVRRGYVDWLRSECQKIVLLGLDARDRQNVRLGQVYVPALTAIESKMPSAARDAPDPLRRGRELEPLLHRLGRESIYVPGAPGSGKSTFCNWVALVAANSDVPPSRGLPPEFVETMPAALGGRFPFLCRLRQFASGERWLDGNGEWTRARLEQSLGAWIDDAKPGGLTSSAFADALEHDRCLLVFDGVDEVPEQLGAHYPRRNVLTGIADALPHWTGRGHRVLLTSRPYGVDAPERQRLGLAQADLSPLPRELQDLFVHRWYAAANTADDEQKARGLIEHLDERRDLDDLRPNPMLLTALCVKYDEGRRLPGDLYLLYDAVTDRALYRSFATQAERDLARLRLGAVALAMHYGLPAQPRTTPAFEVSWDEVDEALIELVRTDRASEQAVVETSKKREALLSDSGLLLPRENKRAAFYHASFQEFLAAVRLHRTRDDVGEVLARYKGAPEWRRTLRFLFCAIADRKSPERAIDVYSALVADLAGDRLAADPNPALLVADCLEVAHAREWNLHDFEQPYRQACEDALTRVLPPERARLWQVLGRIGLDDRPGVGVRDGVPDIEWREVSAGPFLYGDGKQTVELPAFRIARYPITNAQFQRFIDAGGYETVKWWHWPKRRTPPMKPAFPYPNHPRERVSWFEATAFCEWLESQLRARGQVAEGQIIRLPTEREWEKAARGGDGREYPWGGSYESGRANIDETWGEVGSFNFRQTSAVGIYPTGASPYKVDDMAGNVWEWCQNEYGPTAEGDDAARVLRGGSWGGDLEGARAASRGGHDPDGRDSGLGFRVVCVSPIR